MGAADRWSESQTSMRAVPVVLMDPGGEAALPFIGVLIGDGIGPLSEGGLDESFRLAVGARRVGTGEAVFDPAASAEGGQGAGVIGGPVVGEDGADADAELRIVGKRGAEEGDDRVMLLVGMNFREGDAGVVVDGHMQVFPTKSAMAIGGVSSDAVARLANAPEFFDVQVQQVAGMGMFIAGINGRGFEHAGFVQPQAGEDAADGGAADVAVCSDAGSGPAGAAQSFDAGNQFGRSGPVEPMRARTAVGQTLAPEFTIAAHPLGGRFGAYAEAGRGQLQRASLAKNFSG